LSSTRNLNPNYVNNQDNDDNNRPTNNKPFTNTANPKNITIQGSYHPPSYQELNPPQSSKQQQSQQKSISLYDSMLQMVNTSKTGYEKVQSSEDEADKSENRWGNNSAVFSLSKAMKDLATDPFGKGLSFSYSSPSSGEKGGTDMNGSQGNDHDQFLESV
jgi:hypothetical protein